MAKKSIDEMIEGRKNLAQKRDIEPKSYFVAKYLGNYTRRSESGGIVEESTFYDPDTEITVGFRNFNGTPHYKKVCVGQRVVFNISFDKITGYIPGRWEEQLNKFFKAALVAKKRFEEETKRVSDEAKARDARENWGLKV
jgi:hypothetical protein